MTQFGVFDDGFVDFDWNFVGTRSLSVTGFGNGFGEFVD